MCGIAGTIGDGARTDDVRRMIEIIGHRGPDGDGIYADPDGQAVLGHRRLSIIDTSDAGRQPMSSADGRYVITYNGEVYNYLELRRELESSYRFTTRTDTEVVLAAFERWGEDCLDKFVGMFSFVVWDQREKTAFAARDRFGVKPFYYSVRNDGSLIFASEIKAIHAAGIERAPNLRTWAAFLSFGSCDNSSGSFWENIRSLRGGHCLRFKNGQTTIRKWYDLHESIGDQFDRRAEDEVAEEYMALVRESVKLRFRSDVPVGINLSGGIDSSTLLGVVDRVQGDNANVAAYTFVTGDERYDELPWVETMIAGTGHPLRTCRLDAGDVPRLAESVQWHQDEPFGGIPTLAYARLFETAREDGSIVLLDGNGMDEQWAGYDYYRTASIGSDPGVVQGTSESPVRPECLTRELSEMAEPFVTPGIFSDKLRNLQLRDTFYTKIPRAMRFNDRVSMRSSVELREPFLDHRLFELALRQPADRKVSQSSGKVMLRTMVRGLIGDRLAEAPKRALQTPQREWLRGELRDWATEMIRTAICEVGGTWLVPERLVEEWDRFLRGESDNSFYIWQWISIALMSRSTNQALWPRSNGHVSGR